jgi:hypothetical protein
LYSAILNLPVRDETFHSHSTAAKTEPQHYPRSRKASNQGGVSIEWPWQGRAYN